MRRSHSESSANPSSRSRSGNASLLALQMQPVNVCLDALKVSYAQCKQEAGCLDQNYSPIIPAAPGEIKCPGARGDGVCRAWPKFTDFVPKQAVSMGCHEGRRAT